MISLASNVTVIPAKKTIGTQKATDKKQKTRKLVGRLSDGKKRQQKKNNNERQKQNSVFK